MVSQFNLDCAQQHSIDELINSTPFKKANRNACSMLIQFYTADTQINTILSTIKYLKSNLPNAVIISATTVGEIVNGRSQTGKNVLGFTLFQNSQVAAIHQAVKPGSEQQSGNSLGNTIQTQHPDAKGVLLLSTPLSINAASLLKGIESTAPQYQLFGGGAGDYASLNNSLISCDESVYNQGVVAVVLSGESLHIDSKTYLGWRALSHAFKVTEVDGLVVKTIDNKPAYEIYQKYLNLENDDNFFLNALEFPFLLQRHNRLLARVPVGVTDDNGLIFVADIEQGESLQLGYGDPDLIISGAEATQAAITEFSPQAIFLYSCGCRRFLMQEDVELETIPFQSIAPTFGFYTYGEFYSYQGNLPLLNSTMVAISIREGEKQPISPLVSTISEPEEMDPYAHKHARIVSRLVQFIQATTGELEHANQAKSLFLANTSHELRTPLTSISGYAEAILEGDVPKQDVHAAVEIIHRQSEHLLALVNDILDISKIEAEKLDMSYSQFNLSDLFAEIESTFQHQAAQNQLQFNVNLAPNLPETIYSERERLHQIILNLCSNALKFTNVGSVTVTTQLLELEQTLRVEVLDTGSGLTKEQITEVFQPFNQLQLSHFEEKPQGTGLGLSISQNLANELGGRIEVTSAKGQGSAFTLFLPINQTSSTITNEPESNNLLAHSNHSDQGKILLAEDMKDNAELFALLLSNAGFDIDVVENGKEAVHQALQCQYDLILLDIQMPLMTGLEAMEFLRFSGIDGPIIALTANAMETDVATYLEQGFTDCIAKPVKKEKLVATAIKYTQYQLNNVVADIPQDKINQLKTSAIQTLKNEVKHLSGLHSKTTEQAQQFGHKVKGVAAQYELAHIALIAHRLELENNKSKQQLLMSQLTAHINSL